MSDLKWQQRYSEAIVTGLIVCVVWGGVTYLAKADSPWFSPMLNGLLAGAWACIACISVLVLRRVPRRPVIPTENNIESCVRAWLDSHKIAVKNDPSDENYFRLRITLDSGLSVTVFRSRREYVDYVQILADLGMRGSDKELLKQFSDDEATQIFLDIKMELARAKMGYGGLVNPPENFHLFRRIPIHPNLTEFIFISMIGELEAAVHLVALVFLKAKFHADQLKRTNTGNVGILDA
jgi:hypothetical protein